MKTYAERSDRYKRNAERFETGLGLTTVALLGLLILAGIGALLMGAVELVRSLL